MFGQVATTCGSGKPDCMLCRRDRLLGLLCANIQLGQISVGREVLGVISHHQLILRDRVGIAAESLERGREQSDTPTEEPWPFEEWPDVPTRFLLCRDDRLLPPDFLRRVVRERLGIVPDEIDAGHCVALSRPTELAERLDGYWTSVITI